MQRHPLARIGMKASHAPVGRKELMAGNQQQDAARPTSETVHPYSDLGCGTAMTDFVSTADRNSGQTVALTLAAVEVVFRRMMLGGFAMLNPAGADHDEFARMVPEKAYAFSDAGSVLIRRSAQMGQEVTWFIADEMTRATGAAAAILTIPNPANIIMAQTGATSWAARLATLPLAICRLALEVQAATMAPIHRVATDNAERLRNGGLTPESRATAIIPTQRRA